MNGNGLVVKRENLMMRKREKETGIAEITCVARIGYGG